MSHDCDEHDDQEGRDPQFYTGSLQVMDLIAIGFRTIGHCTQAIGAGFHMVATELVQAAYHRRELEAGLRARAEADYMLRAWVADDSAPLTAPDPEE